MSERSKSRRRNAIVHGLVAAAALCGFCLAAAVLPVPDWARTGLVVIGFLAFVHLFGKAIGLWRPDADSLWRLDNLTEIRAKGLWTVAGIGTLLACASPASAQQTIWNVPSADVLDKGKVYLEADALWRPNEPNFALFTGRGVYGLVPSVEVGVNFGGFVTPGRSVPIATPNIKWQPWKNETFSVTTGVFGLFYLRGSDDGKPAALGYAHVAAKLPTNTRVTVGGYWGSSGYAAPDPRAGALVGLEQAVIPHLNVNADWFSGENGIGYFTPGLVSTWGAWTFYAGYSIKNGDSNGNAMLLEVGFTF